MNWAGKNSKIIRESSFEPGSLHPYTKISNFPFTIIEGSDSQGCRNIVSIYEQISAKEAIAIIYIPMQVTFLLFH